MESPPYQRRRSGAYRRAQAAARNSGSSYRPAYERRPSPKRQAQSRPNRPEAPSRGHRDRSSSIDRERRPIVNRLPHDHPLILEIAELKQVRWNRLLEWIKIAQRLGHDWHHPDSPDFLAFREEEYAATEQLQKLAGAIALAERNLPFDDAPRRRPASFATRRERAWDRKRKREEESQAWTERKTKTKVEAWMNSVHAKPLNEEKPQVPLLIGSNDSGDELFLRDDTPQPSARPFQDHVTDSETNKQTDKNAVATKASGIVQRNSSDYFSSTRAGEDELFLRDDNPQPSPRPFHANVTGPKTTKQEEKSAVATKAGRIMQRTSSDHFSSTRARADEFLESLGTSLPIRVSTKLPPPPITPLPDLPEVSSSTEPWKASGSTVSGKQPKGSMKDRARPRPSLQGATSSSTGKEVSNEGEQSRNPVFDSASYLRWLSNGGEISAPVPMPSEQPSMISTERSETLTATRQAASKEQIIKQEPVDLQALLRALAPAARSKRK